MKAFLSISVQILLAVLVTVISVLAVSSIIELNFLKHRETRTLHDKGVLTADRIANSLAYPLWNLNREGTERVVLDEISSAEVSRIQVFDENGALYVCKVRGADGAIRDIGTAGTSAVTLPNAPLYSFPREVNFKNTRIGSVNLDVTDAPLQTELRELRNGIAVRLLLLAVILSVVLFVALRALVIRPLSTLKSWVENMPALSTDEVAVPSFKYSGEINLLADTFGRMSVSLRRKNQELESEKARLQELNRQLLAEIDERKRAEESLRIAREQSETLISTIDGIVWEADAKTFRFTFVSPQAERFLGYPCERWLAEPTFWADHIHPDDRDDAVAYCVSCTARMQAHEFEYRMIAADGREVWLRDIVAVVAENGEPKTLRGLMLDVTQRKRAEEELRTSESLFSKAFSLGPHRMGIIRLKDGVFIDVNDRWLQETGFQREEIIGRSIFEMRNLTGGDVAGTKGLVEAGKPFREVELHLTTKTGAERIVLSSGEIVEFHGEPCLLFAANDITERKQAEERITLLQTITMDVAAAKDLTSALEVVLRRICEKTGWVLAQAWIPNLELNTLDCCPASYSASAELEEFRASTRDQLFRAGQGLPGRVWESGQPAWIRDVTQDTNFPRAEFARRAGLKAALAVPIISGDEIIAVLEFYLREPRDEDERLVEAINIIAAQIGLALGRKRADEALRASEERFSKAFSLAPQRMGMIRISDGVVLYVNDRWVLDTGFTREEIVNHSIFDLDNWIGPEERNRFRQLLEQGKPFHDFEGQIRTKEGEVRVAVISAEVIELNGEPCMLWGTNDITERKRAEEALRTSTIQLRALSARLQSAREEEGARIAREIHDEMGSSLTSLKWDLERIDKDLSTSDNNSGITEARARIGSMTGLIESTINTVRRISSDLRPGVLDDLGLVAAIDWQAQQFQARTGIQYHSHTELDSIDLNRESATAVFRIFQEILTNVLRHSGATGIHVRLREQGDYLELEVKDNGRGITEKEKDNTGTLGLLGMKERALLVAGKVEITGVSEEGTTVVVRVPLAS